MIDKETYISVLKSEREKLLKEFFKPDEEGTGHFNTTAGVLNMRIKQIEEEGVL